jgi:NADPH-dependent glutamate synthase beta subunit-like oxidoreductase
VFVNAISSDLMFRSIFPGAEPVGRSSKEASVGTPEMPVVMDAGYVAVLSDRYQGPGACEVLSRLQEKDMAEVRAIVSWRGVVLSNPDADAIHADQQGGEPVCLVNLALQYLRLIQEESCGRCGPCRIGVDIMRELFEKLAVGQGDESTVGKIRSLAENIEDSAWCGVANTIREPILAILDLGEEHFAEHAKGITCVDRAAFGWMTAPCRSTCPSTVDCAGYIFQALEEHPHLATTIIKRDNPLPALIGRTCPHPCESNCTLAAVGRPVAINNIKRWCADRAEDLVNVGCESGCAVKSQIVSDLPEGAEKGNREATLVAAATVDARTAGHELSELATAQLGQRLVAPEGCQTDLCAGTGKKVAIVGAGPAGLSAAYYLARLGYSPVIFETLPVPGGMTHVGIPEYRLPRHVIGRETELIQQEGVEIRYNTRLGRDIEFADLEAQGFEATFVAVGAHLGRPLGIPGEDLPGSMDAIDFLRRVALGEKVEIGDRVLVLGGGNSAMDAARTSIRLGAKQVRVVYRRGRNEMPANPWEIEEAEEEGVEFLYLAAPVECRGDEGVQGLVCQQMELGEPDESGRRRPVPSDMAPFVLEADSIIAAVGQKPDFSPLASDESIRFNRYGYLEIDPHTLMTSRPGVFVGGDAVSGGGTIIEAVNAGKVAAKYIDKYLRGVPMVEDIEDKTKRLAVYLGVRESCYPLSESADYGQRQPMPSLPVDVRKHTFDAVELGYTLEQATAEADRCLRCHRPILVVC